VWESLSESNGVHILLHLVIKPPEIILSPTLPGALIPSPQDPSGYSKLQCAHVNISLLFFLDEKSKSFIDYQKQNYTSVTQQRGKLDMDSY